jgi:hypothetical protein
LISKAVIAGAGAGVGAGQIATITLSNVPVISDWRIDGDIRNYVSISCELWPRSTISGTVR